MIGIVLAPLAAVIAAVATPILVALRRRRGEELQHRDILWPAVVTAFVIVAVNAALAFFLRDKIGDNPLVTILGIEVAAVLAAGVALCRMGNDSYPQAVIDAALAFLAPVALCIAFIVVGYRVGAFYADISLVVWLPALRIAAAVISAQTGIVYGALTGWIFRQPFGGAAVVGVMGAFVSIIVTGLVFYFFQPGEPFVRAVLGRAAEDGSVLSGFGGVCCCKSPTWAFAVPSSDGGRRRPRRTARDCWRRALSLP